MVYSPYFFTFFTLLASANKCFLVTCFMFFLCYICLFRKQTEVANCLINQRTIERMKSMWRWSDKEKILEENFYIGNFFWISVLRDHRYISLSASLNKTHILNKMYSQHCFLTKKDNWENLKCRTNLTFSFISIKCFSSLILCAYLHLLFPSIVWFFKSFKTVPCSFLK